MREDICITIPTRRPPPVLTLESYTIPGTRVLIIADPDEFKHHTLFYDAVGNDLISVVKGDHGMGAQSSNCYYQAHAHEFEQFLRLDDDLPPKTFVHKNGRFPQLEEIITELQNCIEETDTSLAGLVNTSNRSWLSEGYGLTYGIIHGGCNISWSTNEPHKFIDFSLPRCEDIYRTCAHRAHQETLGKPAMNGRVKSIGFDKSKSTSKHGKGTATYTNSREVVEATRAKIMEKFGRFISKLDDEGVRFRP
jgi:hypothetical protein